MTPRRRRYLERRRPRDTRELVIIGPDEIPCDVFRREVSLPVMSMVDAMPPEWRALVHEFGADAHQLYDESAPVFSHQRRMSASEARGVLERVRSAEEVE
jgi:hypothetical protein